MQKLITEAPLPRIRLTSAVRDAIAKDPPTMGDHHTGVVELSKPETKFGLTIRTYKEEPPKAFVVVSHNAKTLILFTRCGLTNFARSMVDLHGVPISCAEQAFKLMCVSAHYDLEGCTNCDDVMKAILTATKPRFAKTATNALKGFSPGLWNAQSERAMVAAIMLVCTNKETFERFKTIGAFAGGDDLLVLEANDDSLWGINMFADAFMDKLLEAYAQDQGTDLFDAAARISKGDNKLGKILTRFLGAIRAMEHIEYTDAVKNIMFAELV